jgi:predicted nucleic acid-binding protein
MSEKYVLDACSLIAYFGKEEGSEHIKAILDKAVDGDVSVLIHRINLYEVYYDLFRSLGSDSANFAIDVLKNSVVSIIDVISEEMMVEAARFKLSYKVSVADSFALAIAKLEDAVLVTSDHHEFSAVAEAHDVSINWFR